VGTLSFRSILITGAPEIVGDAVRRKELEGAVKEALGSAPGNGQHTQVVPAACPKQPCRDATACSAHGGEGAAGEVMSLFLGELPHDTCRERFTYNVTRLRSPREFGALVEALWSGAHRGGVLSKRLITLFLHHGLLLEGADPGRTQGASYDLRLGDEHFTGGRRKHLSQGARDLRIEPYDYAVVSAKETSILPNDICARFALRSDIFRRGLLISNGPQVDPGYRGPIVCYLLNVTDRPVRLTLDKPFATLEFCRLVEPTEPYAGRRTFEDFLPESPSHGGIRALQRELAALRLRHDSLIIAATFAIVAALAMVTIVLTPG